MSYIIFEISCMAASWMLLSRDRKSWPSQIRNPSTPSEAGGLGNSGNFRKLIAGAALNASANWLIAATSVLAIPPEIFRFIL